MIFIIHVGDYKKVLFKCPLNNNPVIFFKEIIDHNFKWLHMIIRIMFSQSASDKNRSIFCLISSFCINSSQINRCLDVFILNLNKTSIGRSNDNP